MLFRSGTPPSSDLAAREASSRDRGCASAKRASSSAWSEASRSRSIALIGGIVRVTFDPMAEIRAEITANVWQVVAEEGQMVAEGDEICILESMKMEIPVVTEVPGVVREIHVEPEQVVQEGDLIALIDES